MQKYLIFFFIIGLAGFVYFSYITVISKSMQNQGRSPATETKQILAEQSREIKRLNQDYRDIIDRSKRQTQEASRKLNNDSFNRDLNRTLEDNKRQMENNRRQMEQMRRELKRR